MYLAVKQQVKQLSKEDYKNLKKLSHIAKNLTNEAIYNVRQHYFKKKEYLNYYENWKLLKQNSVNYKKLQTHIAQQIIQQVDYMFKSFFSLLKLKNTANYQQTVNVPNYLQKDGFTTLIITDFNLKNNKLIIPYSRSFKRIHKKITIKTPPILKNKGVKIIKIVPKANARYFEIQYIYKVAENKSNLNTSNALGIDLGVNNLATCATNIGKSFIIDGKRLKSINQWYNKENSRLQSIKDKQKHKKTTRRQELLTKKRNNRVNDYMSKAARLVINFCLNHNIGVIICSNNNFQQSSKLGKINNQNFVNIPFGIFRNKLEYLC